MERSRKFEVTKDELERLYQFYSCAQIGEQFSVSAETVRKTLKRLGVHAKSRGGRRRFEPPKEALEAMYQTKSMREMALEFGVGETVVFKRLKEHGIELKEHRNHRLKPGRIFTEEHKANIRKVLISKAAYGEKNPNWKGGLTEINRRARTGWQAREWREKSLERAGHKCEDCGVKQGHECECCGVRIRLHVHHVKSFAKFPEHRFDPANSEVLCPKCHHTRH